MIGIVSIVLPTHKRPNFLRKAIESALFQNYKDIELLIINDASSDETSEIIAQYAKTDGRITEIKNEKQLGLARSLNRGIQQAKGLYIARLDDDDFWSDARKLEKQVKFLETHPEYILVGAGQIRIDEKGNERIRYLFPETDEQIRKVILLNNPFAHTSVLFRKNAWKNAGGYDENLDFSEDWDLWMRFGKIGKLYNLQEYVVTYLQSNQNRSNFNVQANARLNLNLRRKYQKDYPHFWKGFLIGLGAYVLSLPIVYLLRSRLLQNLSYWKISRR